MKRLFILFFVISMLFVSLPGFTANPSAKYLKELKAGRFTRTADGVIKDHKTGLQWKEGPDQSMNWLEAQTWIDGLGKPWRTPTIEELKGIYLSESARQGKPFVGLPALNLRLDPAFSNNSYMVWSVAKDSSLAWYFGFYDGAEYWYPRDASIWRFRTLAVCPAPKSVKK